MVVRIAFLGEFSKDEAQIRRRNRYIPNRSDADGFKVRISLVWRQFQLVLGHVPAADFCLPCLLD